MYMYIYIHVCIHVQKYVHFLIAYINNMYMHTMYIYPGAKVRVIMREARYYAKTRAFASFYAIISRAHAAHAVT